VQLLPGETRYLIILFFGALVGGVIAYAIGRKRGFQNDWWTDNLKNHPILTCTITYMVLLAGITMAVDATSLWGNATVTTSVVFRYLFALIFTALLMLDKWLKMRDSERNREELGPPGA
jgi:hypothetical protein